MKEEEEENDPQTEDNAHPIVHAMTTTSLPSDLLLDPHSLGRDLPSGRIAPRVHEWDA
jgi:hypothetical protein